MVGLKFYVRIEAKLHLQNFAMTKSLIETTWNQHGINKTSQKTNALSTFETSI